MPIIDVLWLTAKIVMAAIITFITARYDLRGADWEECSAGFIALAGALALVASAVGGFLSGSAQSAAAAWLERGAMVVLWVAFCRYMYVKRDYCRPGIPNMAVRASRAGAKWFGSHERQR